MKSRNFLLIKTITIALLMIFCSKPCREVLASSAAPASTTPSAFSGRGEGSAENPYIITSLRQLNEVRHDLNANYLLRSDIDMGFTAFTPIGATEAFTGTFDGSNHMLLNLKVTDEKGNSVGLFGNLSNATIKNLHVNNIDIAGKGNAGALAGTAHNAVIDKISVAGTGTVSGNITGGLLGKMTASVVSPNDPSTVTNSYAAVAVTGNTDTGGLIGHVSGSDITIANSFTTGAVKPSGTAGIETQTGGFIGFAEKATIENCYANGAVTTGSGFIGAGKDLTVKSSFYNKTKTNVSAKHPYERGRTQTQLSLPCTFTGWDFSGGASGGTWIMCEEGLLPYINGLPNPYASKSIKDNESKSNEPNTPIPDPLSTPTLYRNGITAYDFYLTWDDVRGASHYEITINNRDLMTNVHPYGHVTGLIPNTVYTGMVRAISRTSESLWSIPVEVRTDHLPAPKGLASSDLTYNSVHLSWHNVHLADYYEISVVSPLAKPTPAGSQDFFPVHTENGHVITKSDDTNITITDLKPNVSYTYTVRAVSHTSVGYWSEPSEIKTDQLLAPTSLTESDLTYTNVTLSWDPVPLAERYEIAEERDGNVTVLATSETLSTTLTQLLSDYPYTLMVRGISPTSTGYWSTQLPIKTDPLPAPVGLESDDVAFNYVSLLWEEVPGAEQYEITINDPVQGDTIISSDKTTAVITELLPEIDYTFRVRAVSTTSTSEWSEALPIRTLRLPAPTGFGGSDLTQFGFTFTWEAVPLAESYEIAHEGNIIMTVLIPYAEITGLKPNTVNNFTVRAISPTSTSEWSESVGVHNLRLATPTGLTVTEAGLGSFHLSWNPVLGAEWYEIAQGGHVIMENDMTTAVVTGLTPNIAYTFKVRAVSATSDSEWSESVHTEPDKDNPVRLTTPTGLTASDITRTGFTLSWNAVEGAYAYEVRQDGVVVKTELRTPSVEIMGLKLSTPYTFSVRAISAASESDWSTELSVQTSGAPVVTGLSSNNISLTGFTLTWAAVPEAESYEVAQNNNNNVIQTVRGTEAVIEGLTPNSTNTFMVRARSEAFTSGWSTPLSVPTLSLTQPTGLNGRFVSTDSVNLTWNAVPGALSYEVAQGGTVVTTSTHTSATVTGLSQDTSYVFTVQAILAGTVSGWSAPVTVHTKPAIPAGVFNGGNGTEAAPYLISTPAQLQAINDYLDSHFRQTGDIDMQGVAFTPIGDEIQAFTGTFDGGDFTISNLSIIDPSPLSAHVELIMMVRAEVEEFITEIIAADMTAEEIHEVREKLDDYDYHELMDSTAPPTAKPTPMGSPDIFPVHAVYYDDMDVVDIVNDAAASILLDYALSLEMETEEYTGISAAEQAISAASNWGTNVGLFGKVRNAHIKKTRLHDVNILGSAHVNIWVGTNVGALIGRAEDSQVENCRASGSVTGTSIGAIYGVGNIGGLIGQFETVTGQGAVLNSSSSVNVKSSGTSGGLIGDVRYSPQSIGLHIDKCYATGNVTVESFPPLGGLIGRVVMLTTIDSPVITNCYATGSVSGSGNAGGFVGSAGSYGTNYVPIISNCYATGAATGRFAGGFIGEAFLNIHISDSFSIGKATPLHTDHGGAGGFMGYADVFIDTTTKRMIPGEHLIISNCYSADSSRGFYGDYIGRYAGGMTQIDTDTIYYPEILNEFSKTVKNSYFNSGLNATHPLARTTAQMKTQSTFLGWDFNTTWQIDEGTSYPYLRSLPNPFSTSGNNGNDDGNNTGGNTNTGDSNSVSLTLNFTASDVNSEALYDCTVSEISLSPNRLFTVTYDANKLELLDFAGQTPKPDITTGPVPGTELEIISITPGTIRFITQVEATNGASYSGTLSLLRFKVKQAGEAVITLSF